MYVWLRKRLEWNRWYEQAMQLYKWYINELNMILETQMNAINRSKNLVRFRNINARFWKHLISYHFFSPFQPGGSFFITTLNKTAASYALAVVAAEYVFKLNAPGTHDWNKFVAPETLETVLKKSKSRLSWYSEPSSYRQNLNLLNTSMDM